MSDFQRKSSIMENYRRESALKVQVGNDPEKAPSERNSHSKNRGGKNLFDN